MNSSSLATLLRQTWLTNSFGNSPPKFKLKKYQIIIMCLTVIIKLPEGIYLT